MVAARCVRAEIAAAMRCNDLEAWEAIERSLEDQVLQGDRGIERIADGVRQPAIALETLGELRRALRMDEQHCAEFFRLGPDGMEFRIGKILAQHAAADRSPAQALFLDRRLQLLHREIGILQWQGSEGGTRLPLTLTGRRGAFGCARAASSIPQLQKVIPLAATPLRKFLRVVIGRLP
jgi:hypothetical protein